MPAAAVQQSTGGGVGLGSTTRWCPTPEQLMILEEMYRGGLRTPNASQIQQITAHLAAYGRIEGKNVFYWFQNHKARDRQKLRRRICMSHHLLSCAQYYAAAAAAGAGHHHHLFGAAANAPAAPPPFVNHPTQHYQPGHQLLSPTSTTTTSPAAYAAGYYYPFAAAATPPSRSPTMFQSYQGGGGGHGVFAAAAAAETMVGRPETYSLGKLVDNFGVALEEAFIPAAAPAPPTVDTAAATFCRPLKTLDLFPGALKEEPHHA